MGNGEQRGAGQGGLGRPPNTLLTAEQQLVKAMKVYELEPAHIAGYRQRQDANGKKTLVIVTQGGRKLEWPPSGPIRSLTQAEKDGQPPPKAPLPVELTEEEQEA